MSFEQLEAWLTAQDEETQILFRPLLSFLKVLDTDLGTTITQVEDYEAHTHSLSRPE